MVAAQLAMVLKWPSTCQLQGFPGVLARHSLGRGLSEGRAVRAFAPLHKAPGTRKSFARAELELEAGIAACGSFRGWFEGLPATTCCCVASTRPGQVRRITDPFDASHFSHFMSGKPSRCIDGPRVVAVPAGQLAGEGRPGHRVVPEAPGPRAVAARGQRPAQGPKSRESGHVRGSPRSRAPKKRSPCCNHLKHGWLLQHQNQGTLLFFQGNAQV